MREFVIGVAAVYETRYHVKAANAQEAIAIARRWHERNDDENAVVVNFVERSILPIDDWSINSLNEPSTEQHPIPDEVIEAVPPAEPSEHTPADCPCKGCLSDKLTTQEN